jgi:hypothetical protein
MSFLARYNGGRSDKTIRTNHSRPTSPFSITEKHCPSLCLGGVVEEGLSLFAASVSCETSVPGKHGKHRLVKDNQMARDWCTQLVVDPHPLLKRRTHDA